MPLPLGFLDIGIWAAITSLMILTTSEILSSISKHRNVRIDRKRLRKLGTVLGVIFVWVASLKIADVLIGTNLLV